VCLPCEARQLEQGGDADEVMDGRDRGERGSRWCWRLRASQEWSDWKSHPTHFASGEHFAFFDEDERRRTQVRRSDIEIRAGENWWGKAITVARVKWWSGSDDQTEGHYACVLRPSAVLVTLLAFALVGACAKRFPT